jgi:hypothetical protein
MKARKKRSIINVENVLRFRSINFIVKPGKNCHFGDLSLCGKK